MSKAAFDAWWDGKTLSHETAMPLLREAIKQECWAAWQAGMRHEAIVAGCHEDQPTPQRSPE